MINAIIIEDELNSQELLQQLLDKFCKEVNVLGTATNALDGIELVKAMQPDLVFLDIEMPGGSGFELLKAFDPIPFKIIFVTGYDEYAIQAIRFSALDYLLKPVSIPELRAAVNKSIKQLSIDQMNIQNLEWNFDQNAKKARRLVLSSDRERVFIKLDEVLFIEAKGGYVTFTLEGARKQMATHSLNYYEELLPPQQFFRTHKSYIVNCRKVSSVKAGRGGAVILDDGSSVPIAFRRKSSFVQLLGLND